jgi:hypothetical protein
MEKIEWHPNGTPGPWEFEPDERFGLVGGFDRNGDDWIICDMSTHVDLICNAAEHLSASILSQVETNARAIAEVPAMVASYREDVAEYDRMNPMRTADMHCTDCRCERCRIDEKRAVLRRIDGETGNG